MELEQVISELKQLREDFAELKNKFEFLLGQAGWFRYNPAPAASAPLNYISCNQCGIFYLLGSLHVCINQKSLYTTPGTTQTSTTTAINNNGPAFTVANLSGN